MRCGVKAYVGNEPFLFVSYSHFDAALVYPIIEHLVKEGYRVWYDDGIHPGEDWTETVADRLDESAVCLAMLTEHYVASVNCRNEISYSLSEDKRLIGIKLTDFEIPKGIRLQLGNTLYLEKYRYAEEEFYQRFSLSHGVAECRAASASDQGAVRRPVAPPPTVVSGSANRPAARKKAKKRPLYFVGGAVLILLCGMLAARNGVKQREAATAMATLQATQAPATRAPVEEAQPKDSLPTEAPREQALTGWTDLLDMPTAEEIRIRNGLQERPPALAGIFYVDDPTYLAYSVDFKAGALPLDTSCGMAGFTLAYPMQNEQVAASYALMEGNVVLQRQETGSTVSLLFLRNGSYTDASGQQQLIQGKLIYPRGKTEQLLDNEKGVGYLSEYALEEGHWYRMRLQCNVSLSGTTILEFLLQDLETGKWACQCKYDLGVPSVSLWKEIAICLQDSDGSFGGEVRALEFKNVRICTMDGDWIDLTEGDFAAAYDSRRGSYRYAAEGDTFYMVSTGVENKAGTPQEPRCLKVKANN